MPIIFSADETTDVGTSPATTVTADYPPRGNAFTGRVRWVQLDMSRRRRQRPPHRPEERLRIAMARQ